MVVSSPDNFRKTRELGFTIQGLKSRHRRRVETMRVGDRLLYYVTGRMAFAATVTVASPMYEDHTPMWRSARRDEDYPWRVHIRPDIVLDDADWVPAKELAYRLDYVRKWPPEHWTLAFQGHIHALPRNDFGIIEDEIARNARRKRSILILLVVGYVWLVELGVGSSWVASLTAIAYGVGAALTLDEFALWLNLRDVYWERAGRQSIDAVLIFAGLLSVGIWGGPFLRAVIRELIAMFRPRRTT